ncbi:hypothetical protein [Maribacter polysaccharolyticus]|uniref:hypothetical protein n=1 Tax=Maribacter polysaccharolyticus TaxID=3020831 RepID=UPI00237F03F9|nr:hypothetical protein [Maribacter polysaccharolyticus]MDE3744064.1 hypothetical protein [Maribacter polysaccharolyticus]
MESFTDQNLTFTFNCDCGSKEFEREEDQKQLRGFFEGHFVCSNEKCNKHHDYTSKAFKRNFTQTSLFN